MLSDICHVIQSLSMVANTNTDIYIICIYIIDISKRIVINIITGMINTITTDMTVEWYSYVLHAYVPAGLTFSSQAAIPIPLDAPAPARPMKCPLPILLANREAPIWTTINHNTTRSMRSIGISMAAISRRLEEIANIKHSVTSSTSQKSLQ